MENKKRKLREKLMYQLVVTNTILFLFTYLFTIIAVSFVFHFVSDIPGCRISDTKYQVIKSRNAKRCIALRSFAKHVFGFIFWQDLYNDSRKKLGPYQNRFFQFGRIDRLFSWNVHILLYM